MAKIEFYAYQIHEVHERYCSVTKQPVKSFSIKLGIGSGPPFPTQFIEATAVRDIVPAFDAYVEEAKATGQRLQLTARVKDGRSPAGFDAARKDKRLIREVNI